MLPEVTGANSPSSKANSPAGADSLIGSSTGAENLRLSGVRIAGTRALGRIHLLKRDQALSSASPDPLSEVNLHITWDELRAKGLSLFNSKKEMLERRGLKKEAQLFDTYSMMTEDPDFAEVLQKHLDAHDTLFVALTRAAEEFAAQLRALTNPYLQERAKDVEDFAFEMQRLLQGQSFADEIHSLKGPTVLIARDITATEVLDLADSVVKAVILEQGTKTSHVAIFLKSLNIPALFQVSRALHQARTDALAFIDAAAGEVIVNLSELEVPRYEALLRESEERRKQLQALRQKMLVTADGHEVAIWGNAGQIPDVKQALDHGAAGVGLFRTEFLFLEQSSVPSEEEQFGIYREILKQAQGRPVSLRTMDIGGDKEWAHLKIAKETNPFLGVRGLRLSLRRPDLFLPQLRALMRAAEFGPLQIMVPMVSQALEWRTVRQMFEGTWQELNLPFAKPQLGLMLEVPSLLFELPEVSRSADFISVGSNDLVQYLFAADRNHPELQDFSGDHPLALYRALAWSLPQVASTCKISICGELASRPQEIPRLVALGIQNLSMSPSQMDEAREVILQMNYGEAKQSLARELGVL